jgi:hypothetical protein
MEKRVIIFWNFDCEEIGRTNHDSSIINSLPRKGDTIRDTLNLSNKTEEKIVDAIVQIVMFDYTEGIVKIFAEIEE